MASNLQRSISSNISNIKLEQDERPEILCQRLMSFIEDKLLIANGHITHHREAVDHDEEKSPTLEMYDRTYMVKAGTPELPNLVKQRYVTEQ